MRAIPLVLRISRLFTAFTLLAGLSGSGYAEAVAAPSSPYKGGSAALQPNDAKRTVKSPALLSKVRNLKLPMYFEENRGQTDASVKFFTRAGGYNLYLTGPEAVMVVPGTATGKTPDVVRMKLNGANATPSAQGLDVLAGHTNYFIGKDRAKWQTGVKQYARVKVGQVYPGIDMVYRFDQRKVEYDFVVAPGANPWRIMLGFEGAKDIRLDPKGNLVLRTGNGELTYNAPRLYQKLGSRTVPVKGRFVLASNKNVRLEVGNYIKNKELIIDPALGYSSYLGGSVDENANAITVDSSGNAFLTGYTLSTPVTFDFPGVAAEYQPTIGGGKDAFVTKVNANGTLAWSTYYGGAADDIGLGIGVDGTGKVYISGSTTGNIPAKTNQFGAGGGTDAFIAAFASDGKTLLYADQFGGPQVDSGNGIVVDAAGNAYVTGVTGSIFATGTPPVPGFPTTPLSAQPFAVAGAQTDAFVAKFDASGNQVYATYLGGTGIDAGNAIAIDGTGKAYVTGECGDAFFDPALWPNVYKKTISGASDAFIAILDATGHNFVYKTYVGGSNINVGTGIAVDSVNDIYITGYTFSGDFPGPGNDTNAVPYANAKIGQTVRGTAPDAFVFKLRPFTAGGGANDGVYSTYLGASGDDRATGISVDSAFNAYVTGITYSGDFPLVDPIAGGGSLVGSPEAFVTQLGPTGGVIGFSTYLGGTEMTGAQGIAVDSVKNIYVTGWSNSSTAPLPTVTPFQVAGKNGSFDAFVSKFGSVAFPPAVCTISGIDPVSGFTIGGTTVTITGTGFVAYSGPGGVTFDAENAESYTVNTASTVITAVSPRHPLTGALTTGSVPLTVTTLAGTCSATYNYTLSPVVGGVCGDDFFFPSPATGATATFAYCMALPGTVTIKVYNAIGDLVAKITDVKAAGAQSSVLNTGRLASGVYLYRLEKDYGGGNSTTSKVKKFVVRH